MARKLPPKDVVIVGLGWTGSILANELTDEGLDVIAIERGPWRDTATDYPPNYAQDELRYRIRHELFLRPAQTTFTFRNKIESDGSADSHLGRFHAAKRRRRGRRALECGDLALPAVRLRAADASHAALRRALPAGGHDDSGLGRHLRGARASLRPVRVSVRHSGTAGNLQGQIQEGGNPFEGPRSRPIRIPAQQQPFSHTLFAKAARELGYKPFPQPSGNMSQRLHESAGRAAGPLHLLRLLRMVRLRQLFQGEPANHDPARAGAQVQFHARDHCEVTRINVDPSGKRATGVTFVDTSGEEWEQPAELVILSAYTIFNVQLLLLSGIGRPYDPVANKGVIGRNFTTRRSRTCDELLRQVEVHVQSVHRLGRDRHVHRRVQRRQLRSRPAWFRRRRLHGPGADQRPADRNHTRAAGHAALGRAVEAGGA